MGADFVALIPSTSAGMSYGYVHTIRQKLVSMVSPELGELLNRANWTSTSGMVWDIVNTKYDAVIEGLEQISEISDDDVVLGVLIFVNHSDCDGEFSTEDCVYVLKALKKLAETDNDEAIEKLIKVFDNAVDSGGFVTIW
jgi:hypothetical protein